MTNLITQLWLHQTYDFTVANISGLRMHMSTSNHQRSRPPGFLKFARRNPGCMHGE